MKPQENWEKKFDKWAEKARFCVETANPETKEVICPLCGIVPEKLKSYISKQIKEARQQEYERGVKDGINGKFFNSIELNEVVKIPTEILNHIRQQEREEILKEIENIPTDELLQGAFVEVARILQLIKKRQ